MYITQAKVSWKYQAVIDHIIALKHPSCTFSIWKKNFEKTDYLVCDIPWKQKSSIALHQKEGVIDLKPSHALAYNHRIVSIPGVKFVCR
jgi:hypothetical protein